MQTQTYKFRHYKDKCRCLPRSCLERRIVFYPRLTEKQSQKEGRGTFLPGRAGEYSRAALGSSGSEAHLQSEPCKELFE